MNKSRNTYHGSHNRLFHVPCSMFREKKGFSMIEVITVIALVSILSIVVVNLFIGQNRIYKTQTAELGINAGARNALDDIDASVRSSSAVLGSYASFIGGAEVLILQVQSVDAQDRLIDATYDHIVYYLNGTDLVREIFPDVLSVRSAGTKQFARNVSGLVFIYSSATFSLVTEVDTDITLQENTGIQTNSITVSSKSKIRNK